MNPAELTGRSRTHIADLGDPPCAMHLDVIAPFTHLCRAAQADGFDPRPVSGFRDFPRQLAIWNAKFAGERPMLDTGGAVIEVRGLTAAQRVDAILLWSAIPGGSRHHWGTDLDLIDARAAPDGYRVRLAPDEFAAGGPFAAFDAWLEVNAGRFGFFRPFRGVRSGVSPEPWHLSFAPIAEPARESLTPAVLRAAIEPAPMLGKDEVIARLDLLHARYVAAIDWP